MYELFAQQKPRHIAMAAEFDLSPMQAFALRQLEPGTPLAMSDLAEALHCDASNVTGIVDRLEARGLIARRGADHDRRVKMLVVTDKGAELRERLLARISEPPPAIASLSAADQRSLRDILRRALG
jgi:DNA-binding MarR family transcriptional regulator